MHVSEIMADKPVIISPAERVDDIAKVMKERGISSLILVTNGKPVGIVTERDLVHRVLALEKDPKKLMAADISSMPVIVVSVDCPVEDAVDIMHKHKIRRLV